MINSAAKPNDSTKTEYDTNNIFAKILRGTVPAKKIYEDDDVLAIEDISPAAPVHVLVMPKAEYVSFDDFALKAGADKLALFFKKVAEIAKQLNVNETGYRLITNHGEHASQSVRHFHVHIIAGRPLGGLLQDDHASR